MERRGTGSTSRRAPPRRYLRLVALALALLAGHGPASAQAPHRAATTANVYLDDDATTVITSVTRATVSPWEGGSVSAGYLIDIISSASVDVISQATESFREHRHALTSSMSQELGEHVVRASYGYSVEMGRGKLPVGTTDRIPDYQGHGAGVGGDLSLFERNTTLTLDYALELGEVGRAGDRTFLRGLTTQVADVHVSQVLSKRLLGALGWTLTIQDGYTAKPYRFARVGTLLLPEEPGSTCELCPPETHPERRYRNAALLGAKLHLFAESALEGTYRLYFDDWGLLAHTAEAQLHLGWTEAWGLRLRYRLHHQGGATFWEDVYEEPRRYMTADRELSPLTGHLLGVHAHTRTSELAWGAFDVLGAYAKVDLFRYRYHDFQALPQRDGLVVEAGLEVELR